MPLPTSQKAADTPCRTPVVITFLLFLCAKEIPKIPTSHVAVVGEGASSAACFLQNLYSSAEPSHMAPGGKQVRRKAACKQ